MAEMAASGNSVIDYTALARALSRSRRYGLAHDGGGKRCAYEGCTKSAQGCTPPVCIDACVCVQRVTERRSTSLNCASDNCLVGCWNGHYCQLRLTTLWRTCL
eukprot:1190513-Prorocentrum_minimum.AAC.2